MKFFFVLLILIHFQWLNAQITSIPDPIFEQALIDFNIDSDGIINGQVFTSDIQNITELNIQGMGINDLTGIQAFISLENFNCKLNNFTSLDLTQNVNLRILKCSSNDFTEINLTQNILLEELEISVIRHIVNLDLSANINLTNLEIIGDWNLENLIIPNNLIEIKLTDNWNLPTVDFSNCTNLEKLLYGNSWNASTTPNLSVENNSNLKILSFSNFNITNINLSNNLQLEELYCSNNSLTSLNLENNSLLKVLECGDINCDYGFFNSIINLDLSNNTNLETLICNGIGLENLNINNCSNLKYLDCRVNPLTALDVHTCTNLETLIAVNSNLTTIDLTNNSNLKMVNLSNDMSCDGWQYLSIFLNEFTDLNLDNQQQLTNLNISRNEVIEYVHLQNSNNQNMSFGAIDCPSLNCVFVDDVSNIPTNWHVDSNVHYTETEAACEALDISENVLEKNIVIYPNPSNNAFRINTTLRLKKVDLYSIAGKKIKTFKPQLFYDISKINAGYYFVVLVTENNEIFRKYVLVDR